MKLPADLNPRVESRLLPQGTPVWDVTLTFNETDHTYTFTEMTEYTSVQILLKAIDDGYGQAWEAIDIPETPIFDAPTVEPEKTSATPAKEVTPQTAPKDK